MARNDFMCVSNQPDGTGVSWGYVTASQSFLPGELVFIHDDGNLREFTESDNPLTNAVATEGDGAWGVAAATGDTTGSGNNDVATNTRCPFWPADKGLVFRTNNYYSAATGTAAIPPGSVVGEAFQIARTAAGAFGVLNTAATVGTHVAAKIVAVYDAAGNPILPADTTTGHWVDVTLHTALAIS